MSCVNRVKTKLIIGDLCTARVRKIKRSAYKAGHWEPSGQIQKVFEQMVALFGAYGFRMELNANGGMLCVT